MYWKILFVILLIVSSASLVGILIPVSRIKEIHGKYLTRTVYMAVVAMLANIVITFSVSDLMANIAYCVYFASLDWIILALTGFCVAYIGKMRMIKLFTVPTIVVVAIDTLYIFSNVLTEKIFDIQTFVGKSGTIYYLAKPLPLYDIHLALDYFGITMCIVYMVIGMVKSKGFYKYKYVAILTVLLTLILINAVYIITAFPLDLSVVFYGFAASLIYYFSEKFVPKILTNQSVKKSVSEMNQGFILFDTDGKCIFVNEFICMHFKLREETCTAGTEIIDSVTDGKPLNEVLPGVYTYVKTAKNPKNRDRHYRLRLNRIVDGKGSFLGTYIMVDDVTEEYYVMEELASAKEEADGANAAKSNFLANMSHEIRTPLNSLLGMNEMIIREAEDKRLIEYAENIRVAGNSLLSLLNDILDFSKIEAGRMSIVEADYSIHKVLRDCYNILGPSAKDKGLEYRIECDYNVPKTLYGDEMRIRQVLSNLLSNAIKYTSRGSVTVKVEYKPVGVKQVLLKISVIDTGIGISKENQAILFDAFQRVDEAKNRNIEGTGLGLTITRELTALMHGEVDVESELGKGSNFSLMIPQAVVDESPIGPFNFDDGNKASKEYKASFLAPEARILVVDDVPMNLKVVKALLGKTKVYVQIATGGKEAIDLCQNEKYDLIFMDHMMPAPDGVEAFKTIQKDGANRNTPVVVLTANALNGVDKEYKEIGFVDYMSKPVKGADLEKMCIKYLPPLKVTLND
ncbi:MAG: response regulator [Lachnospiraceae bacterium]|nr:response regulator [Lachnospiraceae bacterium]